MLSFFYDRMILYHFFFYFDDFILFFLKRFTLARVKGHPGISGNEAAYGMAKLAAELPQSTK